MVFFILTAFENNEEIDLALENNWFKTFLPTPRMRKS